MYKVTVLSIPWPSPTILCYFLVWTSYSTINTHTEIVNHFLIQGQDFVFLCSVLSSPLICLSLFHRWLQPSGVCPIYDVFPLTCCPLVPFTWQKTALFSFTFIYVFVWGHTQLCSRLTPNSLQVLLLEGLGEPYVVLGIELGLIVCKAISSPCDFLLFYLFNIYFFLVLCHSQQCLGLCTQGTLMLGLEDYIECQRSNSSQLCKRKALCPLYYLSSPCGLLLILVLLPFTCICCFLHLALFKVCLSPICGSTLWVYWELYPPPSSINCAYQVSSDLIDSTIPVLSPDILAVQYCFRVTWKFSFWTLSALWFQENFLWVHGCFSQTS